jgi:hypothetical protein
MTPIKFTPLPAALPDADAQWLTRIVRCATSCAKTMEARKIRSNEIPVVLGALIVALADHSGSSVEQINAMVCQASHGLRDNNPPAA